MHSHKDPKSKIISFYTRHKRMPGYKEMMDLFSFKSKNSVYKMIKKLVDEGVLSKDSEGKISPAKSWNEVPLLGLVEAGIPTSADVIEETISIDEYLIPHKDSSYVLEVKGDSMIEAGIHEGDLVVVERQDTAKDGEIVIAVVDGGWTMKYLRKRGNETYLDPANKDYKPIHPHYQFQIVAVVKGVIRKY